MVGYRTTPSRHSKFVPVAVITDTGSGQRWIFPSHVDARPWYKDGGGGFGQRRIFTGHINVRPWYDDGGGSVSTSGNCWGPSGGSSECVCCLGQRVVSRDAGQPEFFGPDSPPAPTPLRIKGSFNAGARLVDRLLSDINKEHHRHATRTDQQFTSIRESAIFTRGALRADVTLLQTETEEALNPAICNLSGLAALAQKSEQDITGLLETSARTTQDILELRQEIDWCGTLSGLAALAQKSEQDIIGLLETSAKNAQAILELCQEIAGCVAVKTTVGDIKTRQLTQIRENITQVRTGLADMTTQYNTLDMKYSEALDAVNTWVDDILCNGIPPMTAPTDVAATPPVRNTTSSPSSPPTDGASTSTPANVVPDSAPPGDGRMDSGASKDMPRSDAPDRRSESHHARHSARPNLPGEQDFRDTGGSTSV